MTRLRSLVVPAFALLAMAASAQQTPPMSIPHLISTSGNAEAKAAPDMATIRIGVETQGKTAKEAQASTNVLANRIIEAALKVVPDRKAFQTSDLSLNPEYTQPAPNQPMRVSGYRARNVLVIRVEDLSKIGPLVDAATDAGATNLDSISFGLKNDKAARKQALMDAVREAREKAEAMAEGLGLRLGEVYSVEEGGGPIVRPFEMPMMAMARTADRSAPVMPGEVSLSASVTVRFTLVK